MVLTHSVVVDCMLETAVQVGDGDAARTAGRAGHGGACAAGAGGRRSARRRQGVPAPRATRAASDTQHGAAGTGDV